MILRSFAVRGFKNLTQTVKLEGLGPINVIHGPNNIGKSNLLQALQLFFRLIGSDDIGRITQDGTGHLRFVELRADSFLAVDGTEPHEMFNLEKPASISFEAEMEVGADEVERAGVEAVDDFSRKVLSGQEKVHVAVEMQLRLEERIVVIQLRKLVLNGQRFMEWFTVRAVKGRIDEVFSFVHRFLGFLSRNLLVKTQSADRFALVGVDRLLNEELALELYDAKESPELEQAKRWERFLVAMASFKDILGEGSFVTTYDRKASRAKLFYQTSFARIPLRLLGSGVQQSVSLIGQLLMTNATLVAIEEPELNMRYTLQERLRDVFEQKIVGAPGGPSQLFLTSHSPAFESGPHFYLMVPTPEGPRIESRKVEQARLAVGFPEGVVPPGDNAARCYLSTEGVVRVPERIREVLGLPNGGGVMFIENEGHVEMISDERFATMLDATDDGEGDEQS